MAQLLLQPIDDASWMWGQLNDLAPSVHAVFLAGWGAAIVFVFLRSPTIQVRCGIVALVIIGAVLAAPRMHQNYLIWWLPFIAPVLGWPAAVSRRQQQPTEFDPNGPVVFPAGKVG